MLKNRYFSIFAATAVLGLAACGGGQDDAVVEDTNPAVDATAPTMEPLPPATTDTMGMGTMPATTDTMGMGTTTDTMGMGTTTQP